ncbi:putative calcium-binding protein CML44 [Cucumis melo var. makuwa]|uniref:EF-hand domain-containing protein n=2 Tax=Cucumis melo TaxID=3656 RepID=A0A9I9CUG0_CUCME|nr:putative calcium-binding protein CML44 [Cucumis melo var. makuwa]
MSPISSKDLHRIFKKLDKNCDGLLCLQELKWLLDRIGIQLTMEELESFLEKPSLDFDEFLFFYESISKQNKGECKGGVAGCVQDDHEDDTEIVYMAFKVFDMNGDGFISCDELENVLVRLELWDASRSEVDYCRSMIQAYDTNLDGKLDFEEFKNMMLLTT